MAAGIMLARDGHEVTVVERDPDPAPDTGEEAWTDWNRQGISQFRMGHVLLARGRHILARRIPDALDRMLELGALEVPMLPPSTLESWTPRDDDAANPMLGIRRPVIDKAMADTAAAVDGLTVRRGVALSGLMIADDPAAEIPHVTGVESEDGERFPADLVVDAMGRRSPMLRWLAAVGAPAAYEEAVDSGFAYYGQYFHSSQGLPNAAWGLTPFDGFSILALPGDSNTWFIGAYASSNDTELRILRDRETLHDLLRACPLHAPFVDGDALGDVISMVGVTDRDRRFVVNGSPVVTGMVPVADAWACTNPSLGRGMSIGLMHVELLAEFLSNPPEDAAELVRQWDEITHATMRPWHDATRSVDQARAAELDAQRQGRQLEPDPADVGAAIRGAIAAALPYDENVYRLFWRVFQIVDFPETVFGDPENLQMLIDAAEGREPHVVPGPTRAEFLASRA